MHVDEDRGATASRRRRWVALITISIALMLVVVDASVLFTALPVLSEELGATSAQQLWILNAYPVVMAGLLLGAGTLGDRAGHRRMFLGGLVVFTAASLLAGLAPSVTALIAARALLAVGAAAMMPATLAIIRLTFHDDRERATAIAVWAAVSVVGGVAGPVLGGFLLEHFPWGAVFLINVPVGVVVFVVTPLVVRRDRPDPARRWDLPSSLLSTATLVGAVLAIKELAHVPPSLPLAATGVGVAVLAGWAFVARQQRLTDPLLEFDVFRVPRFLAGVVAAVTAMFAIGGIALVVAQRFQLVAGYGPQEAGLLIATIALGALPSSLLGGVLAHRTGERLPMAGGLLLGSVGTVVALLGTGSMPVFVTGLVVAGFGVGAPVAVASTAIVTSVPPHRAGMASSVEEVAYEMGNVLATAILGSGLVLVYGLIVTLPAGVPPEAYESMTGAIAVAGSDDAVLAAARSAYDTGFHVVLGVAALACLLGAATVSRLLRPAPAAGPVTATGPAPTARPS
ncbi:MFS transporter [Myceligenerans cantabricum]